MDSETKSSDEVTYVAIAATLAIKVETVSLHLVNSTSLMVSSDYELPLTSEEAVEPVPYHHNCIGETGEDGIASAMKQRSKEAGSYSVRTSCDSHEFNNVSCDVDTSASVLVKIEPGASYLGNATFVSGETSTNSKNHVELPLNDFNGQTVFTKQEETEEKMFHNDTKNEISDRDVLEITSILEDCNHDLRSQSIHNPTSEARMRKFHEKCEESDMNCETDASNGTERLSCDCNLFVNSEGACNKMKTIRNCSVLLKRLDITNLKTIRDSSPQEQEKFHLDSHFNMNEQNISLQGSVSDRICNNPTSEAGMRKFHEKCEECEESDMNCETNASNGTERLSCDCNLFVNSEGVCNKMKTIRNCSVLLKRLDITNLKTIRDSGPQEQEKFHLDSHLEQHNLIHSAMKAYECSECLKKFSSKYVLKWHKLIHSSKKPYQSVRRSVRKAQSVRRNLSTGVSCNGTK